jgi:hypothetical protein
VTAALARLREKAQRKGGRIQLDLLLRTDRGWITGECKSWGGAMKEPVTWKLVEKIFLQSAEGLFLYLTQIHEEPVAECVLVLWRRSDEHEEIEARLSDSFSRIINVFT